MKLKKTVLFLLVAGLSASAAFAFEPLFDARIDYQVGSNPQSVCAADFDGDGKPDMAVANKVSNTVSILKNNGNGTFASAVNYGVGSYPYSVLAADFDGDGKPDLAVANSNDNTVSILKNNGNGTFASVVNYGVGSYPSSVFAADFDGDGKPDLAVANSSANNISILKNSGNGTFASAVNYGVGSNPRSVFAADIDGDGKADLTVANSYYPFNTVSILKNNGNGTFAGAVNYEVGIHPHSVFAADFDGDGKADLAVANAGTDPSNGDDNISILKNNGNGTFSSAVNYVVGISPMSVVAVDFDGDGKADLAVANEGSNSVSILKNNGDGTFFSAVNYEVGYYLRSVTTADFDGDGKADLAVATDGFTLISILKNNGNGTFASAVNYGVGAIPFSVFAADFDGDGKPDLAVANNLSITVSILKNNGNGTFASAVNYGVESYPWSVSAADFDGDGTPDVATANGGSTVSILINKSSGSNPVTSLFQDDFGGIPSAQWTPTIPNCTWQVTSDTWRTSASGQQVYCIQSAGNASWRNYDYQVDVMGNSGVDKVVNFRLQDANNWYGLNLRSGSGPGGTGELLLTKRVNGGLPSLLSSVSQANTNGQWYRLRVSCLDEKLTVSVNGVTAIIYTDTTDAYYSGGIGITCYTGGFGINDISFDNVLVTDPYPHIVLDSVAQGEHVGDIVQITGRVQSLNGLPFVPSSGNLTVEDPARDITTTIPVQLDGSFSYSASSAGAEEGVYMYVFACNTSAGMVREMYSLPLLSPGTLKQIPIVSDFLIPLVRKYDMPVGPTRQVLTTSAETLIRRVSTTQVKIQNSKIAKGLGSLYGAAKTAVATAHKKAFPTGNFFTELRKVYIEDCTNLNVVRCAKAQGQLALSTVDMPWNSTVQLLDNGVDKLYEKGWIDNCTYQGAKAGIASGDLIVSMIGLKNGEPMSLLDAMYNGVPIGEVKTIIVKRFENCNRPTLSATYAMSGFDGVLMSVDPKMSRAFTATTYSPVDIKVIDPLGREVSRDTIEVPGAEFIEIDMDMDDDLEQLIIVPMDSTLGTCQIFVTAKSGALPMDTFSIVADYTYYQTPDTIADNLLISQVPPAPITVTTFENLAPPASNLSTPDGFMFNGYPAHLTWSPSVDPNPGHIVNYDVIVAKQADFSDSVVVPAGAVTSFDFHSWMHAKATTFDTSRYYWKVFAHDDWGAGTVSSAGSFKVIYCCHDVTGNVNDAGIVDLADLSALVSYLTGGGYMLPCVPEANVNNAGIVDLADLSALVSYLTGSGYALPNCP